MVFVANDKIQDFKQKLKFWKTRILHHELVSFLVLKDFLRQYVVILMNVDGFF